MRASLSALRTPTLSHVIFPGMAALQQLLLVIGGSLALALSAKIQVPFWPVPITMQSMAVLLIGIVYGSRLGALTILAYLAEGVAGLPIFAGAMAGPAYLLGPTGGYLAGFLFAAFFAGWAAERGWSRDLPRSLLVILLGHVLIFAPGLLWLAMLFGSSKAIAVGVVPFLMATALKSGLGAALVSALWAVAEKRR